MFTGIVEALGVVESIQRVELEPGPVVRLVVVDRPRRRGAAARRQHRRRRRLPDRRRARGRALRRRPRPRDAGADHARRARAGRPRAPRAPAQGGRSAGRPHGRRPRRRHRARSWRGASAATRWSWTSSAPPRSSRVLAAKGSIAVDGVSLTINTVAGDVVLGDADPAHARGHQARRQAGRRSPSTSRPT